MPSGSCKGVRHGILPDRKDGSTSGGMDQQPTKQGRDHVAGTGETAVRHRHAVVVMAVVVTAAAALAAGDLLGRLGPWQRTRALAPVRDPDSLMQCRTDGRGRHLGDTAADGLAFVPVTPWPCGRGTSRAAREAGGTFRSAGGESAVDRQGRAGYERGFIAQQERHERGDFLGLGNAVHRVHR